VLFDAAGLFGGGIQLRLKREIFPAIFAFEADHIMGNVASAKVTLGVASDTLFDFVEAAMSGN